MPLTNRTSDRDRPEGRLEDGVLDRRITAAVPGEGRRVRTSAVLRCSRPREANLDRHRHRVPFDEIGRSQRRNTEVRLLTAGGSQFRTLGPPAKAGLGAVSAAAMQPEMRPPVSSLPRSQADMLSAATLKARIRLNSRLGPTIFRIEILGSRDGRDSAPSSHFRNYNRLLWHRLERSGHHALPFADKKRRSGRTNSAAPYAVRNSARPRRRWSRQSRL